MVLDVLLKVLFQVKDVNFLYDTLYITSILLKNSDWVNE